MKKTYIEPMNTVVKLNLETMIAGSANEPNTTETAAQKSGSNPGDPLIMNGRETIKSQDAWEEW